VQDLLDAAVPARHHYSWLLELAEDMRRGGGQADFAGWQGSLLKRALQAREQYFIDEIRRGER
jgi:hypothetical protein